MRWTGFSPSVWNPDPAEISEVLAFNFHFALKYSFFWKLPWKKPAYFKSKWKPHYSHILRPLFSIWASRGRFHEEAFIWKSLCSSCHSFRSFNCKSLHKITHSYYTDVILPNISFHLTRILVLRKGSYAVKQRSISGNWWVTPALSAATSVSLWDAVSWGLRKKNVNQPHWGAGYYCGVHTNSTFTPTCTLTPCSCGLQNSFS